MTDDVDQIRYEIRTHRLRCDCHDPLRFCFQLYKLMEQLRKASPSTPWEDLYPTHFEEA